MNNVLRLNSNKCYSKFHLIVGNGYSINSYTAIQTRGTASIRSSNSLFKAYSYSGTEKISLKRNMVKYQVEKASEKFNYQRFLYTTECKEKISE